MGDKDPLVQQVMAKEICIGQRSRVGELIFAMVMARPDLCHAGIRLSQHNSKQHRLHYIGLKHALRYMVHTKADGIYYWQAEPNILLMPTRHRRLIVTCMTSYLMEDHTMDH